MSILATRDCQISLIKKGGAFQMISYITASTEIFVFPLYLSPLFVISKGESKMEHVGKFLMVFEKVPGDVWLIEKMTLLMVENALAIQQSRIVTTVEKGIHVWCE